MTSPQIEDFNMASVERNIQFKRAVRGTHFWLILAMLVALSLLYYIEQLGIATPLSSYLGLTRHTLIRILFLVPIIYAGFSLRLWAGLATAFIALIIMLPRAILISSTPIDAVVESVGIVFTGVLACFWLDAQLKRREEHRQAITELETVQEELQSHIRLARSNEKRLATLNAISTMLSHSLELKQVLRNALDMVTEVMEAEAALIFSLDKGAQELRLLAYEGVSDRFAQDVDRLRVGEGFNGRVAQTGEPLIVKDASSDPRLTRQVVKQEKIGAQLIVPLRARGLIVGTLCVANRRPRQFLAEEVDLLTAIGGQIGISIENAKFYQEQQRMQENLRFYVQQITRAQEEERKRIARELHDDTTQALVALSHRIEDFASNNKQLSADDIELLKSWRGHLGDALQRLRFFSRDLRPSIVDDLGLVPALEWLTDDLKKQTGIEVNLRIRGTQQRLSPEGELLLFRIIQEAISNARRHAEASKIEVGVEFDEGKIVAIVRDNGKGFELPETLGELSRKGKLGLIGAEERARLLGGSLTVQSEPGKGTTVVVEAPVRLMYNSL